MEIKVKENDVISSKQSIDYTFNPDINSTLKKTDKESISTLKHNIDKAYLKKNKLDISDLELKAYNYTMNTFTKDNIKDIALLFCCYHFQKNYNELNNFYALKGQKKDIDWYLFKKSFKEKAEEIQYAYLLDKFVNDTNRYVYSFEDQYWFNEEFRSRISFSDNYKENWVKHNKDKIKKNPKMRNGYSKYKFKYFLFFFSFRFIPYILPFIFAIFLSIIYGFHIGIFAICITFPLLYMALSRVIYYAITKEDLGDIPEKIFNKFVLDYVVNSMEYIEDFELECKNQIDIFNKDIKDFDKSMEELVKAKALLEPLVNENIIKRYANDYSFLKICSLSYPALYLTLIEKKEVNKDFYNKSYFDYYFDCAKNRHYEIAKAINIRSNYVSELSFENIFLTNPLLKDYFYSFFPEIFKILNNMRTDYYQFPMGKYGKKY